MESDLYILGDTYKWRNEKFIAGHTALSVLVTEKVAQELRMTRMVLIEKTITPTSEAE